MPLVDAALAFAITMLAVATVVTKIVEFLHWLLQNGPTLLKAILKQWLGERATLFKQMIDEFVQKDLTRIVSTELKLDEAQAQAKVHEAVEQIKQRFPNNEVFIHMSNSALLEELKLTDLGKEFLALTDRAELVFLEISNSYAITEKKFTEIFRKNSQAVALTVSLVLAVAFNIDCVNIVETYLHNPTLSASIAATSDKAMADYTAQMAGKPGDPTAEELRKQYQARQQQLNDLNSSGFPFGWSYFPYGPTRSSILSPVNPDTQTQSWFSKLAACVACVATLFTWVIGLAFTVFLAGLGAPFWYDVIRNLVQMTRGDSAPPEVKTIAAKTGAASTDQKSMKGSAPPPAGS